MEITLLYNCTMKEDAFNEPMRINLINKEEMLIADILF